MTDVPGTFRADSDEAVDMQEAITTWAPIAREELLNVARTYNGLIRYGVLAEIVQERSGIRTRQLVTNWIGRVLLEVAEENFILDQPLLASLCIREDGKIGGGYVHALEATDREIPDDLDMAAAEDRLHCYRFFGAQLPEDGGQPTLPPEIADQRSRAAQREQQRRPPRCPRCNIELPLTGVCDNCS